MNTTEAMGASAGITVGDRGRCGLPTAVIGIDVRKLPIGPTEAFVLSRLDGHSDVHGISLTTGLSAEQVSAALHLLVKLGAALWPGAVPPPQAAPAQATEAQRAQAQPNHAQHREPQPDIPSTGPGSLSEPQRERIQVLVEGCAGKTFYELLGIPRSAEKNQVKEAYFSLVAEVHPDRFFGKDLGDLKPKLEALFKRLTEAHDTLTRSRRRAEYDAGLPPEALPPDARRLSQPTPAQAAATKAARVDPAPGIAAPKAASPKATSADNVPQVNEPRSAPIREADHAPATRVSLGNAAVASARVTDPPATSAPRTSQVPSGSGNPPSTLGSRAQGPVSPPRPIPRVSLPPTSLRNTLRSPAERYVQAAAGAQREGNSLSALNSLRIAASILPNDEVLRTRVSDLELDVDRQQLDKLLLDAQQAAGKGDTTLALRLYGRVVKATQSPAHYRQAAEYALSVGQHQQAAEGARKALATNEKDLQSRILLGKIYFEAEMFTSAQREFERASELAPSDPNVKDWLKRISRGDV